MKARIQYKLLVSVFSGSIRIACHHIFLPFASILSLYDAVLAWHLSADSSSLLSLDLWKKIFLCTEVAFFFLWTHLYCLVRCLSMIGHMLFWVSYIISVFSIFVFAFVQCKWTCFTWKGTLEIQSLLLLACIWTVKKTQFISNSMCLQFPLQSAVWYKLKESQWLKEAQT